MTRQLRAGFWTWGAWLATAAVMFSIMSLPHTTYLALLGPPLAALSGTGIVLAWRAYRGGGPRAWTLPGVIAAQAGWTIYLSRHYPDFCPGWCRPWHCSHWRLSCSWSPA